MKLSVGGITNVGLHREHNEDDFALIHENESLEFSDNSEISIEANDRGILFCVVDGMGGASSGEVAAKIAIETIKNEFIKFKKKESEPPHRFLIRLLLLAHQEIVKAQRKDKALFGMGTTAMLAWILDGRAFLVWSGDSRTYLVRKDGQIGPITDDHSMVWDLVRGGKITAEEARNMPESNLILQCLGDPTNPPKPDFKIVDLAQDDLLVLCSDGLNGMLSDDRIFEICGMETSVSELLNQLIVEANLAGGHDNITVAMAKIIAVDPVEPLHETLEFKSENLLKGFKRKMIFSSILVAFVFSLWTILAYKETMRSQKQEEIENSSQEITSIDSIGIIQDSLTEIQGENNRVTNIHQQEFNQIDSLIGLIKIDSLLPLVEKDSVVKDL